MKIQVLYFAVVRERLGRADETLELAVGTDVAGALAVLAARHPGIATLTPHLRVAINQCMVDDFGTRLGDGDELALIPPVAGGSDGAKPRGPTGPGQEAPPPRLAKVVADKPLLLQDVVEAVSTARMGGLATFSGVVRDHADGKPVTRLEYEAYPEMAEKVFAELCEQIEAEIPGTRLAVVHRIGVLAVGDVAVVIAAAAPHRDPAFRACRALIDRLKERAPIWKKQFGPSGASWVGLGP